MCSFEGVDSIQCNNVEIFICTDRIIIVMGIDIECYSFFIFWYFIHVTIVRGIDKDFLQ